MPALWKDSATGYVAQPLQINAVMAADAGSGSNGSHPAFQIFSFREGSMPGAVLICDDALRIRVNGIPVVGGIRVLRHKDEITFGKSRMFFSAESTPVIETYHQTGTQRQLRCPVCRHDILDLQAVVHCPGCARVYHQMPASADTEAKPCWTYSPSCRFCGHPTSLTGDRAWYPDEENWHSG